MITKNSMERGSLHIYGPREENDAFGSAFLTAAEGKKVVVIGFQKGKRVYSENFLKKLEPEMKFFVFEDVKNGLNYARKVLTTGECNLLILSELLTVVSEKKVSGEDLKNLLHAQGETDIILTGQKQEEILSDFFCNIAHNL